MKKYYQYVVLVFIILIIVGFLGCTQGNRSKTDAESSVVENSQNNLEFTLDEQRDFLDDYQSYIQNIHTEINEDEFFDEVESAATDNVEEPVVTSYDLVEEAYENGVIDRNTLAYYTILCGYNENLLPDEYRSNFSYRLNIQYEIQYVIDHWEEIPEDYRNVLEPYLVPIDQPKSIFNQNDLNSKKPKKHIVYAGTINDAVFIDTYTFDGVTFIIEFPTNDAWNDEVNDFFDARVADVKTAIEEVYPKFKSLLNVGLTKTVRVEIIPLGSDYGTTWEEGDEYRLRLNSKLMKNTKTTKTTFVHELFHDFQFEIGVDYSGTNRMWAMEATATWSEHYAYKAYNSEHEYLSDFFSTFHKDRVGYDGSFEYGSYMLFYFLTDYSDSNVVVKDFLYDIVTGGSSAVRSFFDGYYSDFNDQYAQFALYNIDARPLVYYNDQGPLPGAANGSAFKRINMGGNDEDPQDVKLDSGSIQYYFYRFHKTDENARHIEFTFAPITEPSIKRQAAILAEGSWRIEDWTELTEKKYCRDKEDPLEHVDAVILIYSNANLKDTGSIDVDSFVVETDACIDQVRITLTGDYSISGYGNEWKSEFKMVDLCEVIDHNLFVSYDCDYTMSGEFTSDGVTYMISSGDFHEMVFGDITIENGFPRVFYPGALGDDDLYAELTGLGFDENVPETGILLTIPFLDSEPNGSTTFYFPQPVGTVTESIPFMFDGISNIGGIILPEDIREGKEMIFDQTIDVLNYDNPIDTLYTLDFQIFSEQIEGMEGMGEMNIPDLQDLDLPEGFEIPEMENPTQNMIQGLMGIMNPSNSGYKTILTLQVEIEWPEE